MMHYREWMEQDLVIATGQVEGAVRHLVGERFDCAGMRWVKEKAEALLPSALHRTQRRLAEIRQLVPTQEPGSFAKRRTSASVNRQTINHKKGSMIDVAKPLHSYQFRHSWLLLPSSLVLDFLSPFLGKKGITGEVRGGKPCPNARPAAIARIIDDAIARTTMATRKTLPD